MNVSIKKIIFQKNIDFFLLSIFQLSFMFFSIFFSRRMSHYYMPQSTVYFDQRFSPTLVIESPKNIEAASAFDDVDEKSYYVDLNAKD